MPQENVEVVRQALDAYGRRDVDALRRLNSPDLELDWTASKGWLAGLYCGIEEALRFYYEYYDVFESSRVEADCYMPVGDSVVVPNVVHQRGRDGIEVTARSTFVFSLRDGKIIHICLYQSTSEALNALGLEEQAVTQENVELVRRAIAAVNERDLDRYLSCCIDSVELHTPMDPVGGTYSGREDIKRFFADIEEAAPDFRIEVQRLEATGCDQVLAFTCVSSTGRASGIPMDVETTNLYEFTNGKISRIRIFFDRSEALKAVGLEE